jgi:hypothetical protein
MGKQMFMMKNESWPSVVSDDLAQSVGQKICERRRFTISEHECEFPQISCTILYEIISYARIALVLRNMSSENAHGCTQSAENGFGFDSLERYHKDGDGNCFLGQERRADGGIHATRDHSNIICVL